MTNRDMPPHPRTDWFKLLVAVPLVLALLHFGRAFFIPLVVAGLIFILSSALVDRLRKVEVSGHSAPLWLANLIAVIVMISGLLLLIPIFVQTQNELAEALPRYQERFSTIAADFEGVFGPTLTSALLDALAALDLGSLATYVVAQLAGGVSVIALVVMYLAFLIVERNAWAAKLPRLASSEHEARQIQRVSDRISDGIKTYMWVNAVTSLMSASVAYIVFSLIGLDFAAFLAVVVFLVGFIPNIGAFIGVFLPSIVALLQFDSLVPFFIVVLVYGLADQIIANIVMPAMQGRSLSISTFVVMIALTFWAMLWGGIGAFLAMPLTIVLMVICAEVPSMRWVAVLISKDGRPFEGLDETN